MDEHVIRQIVREASQDTVHQVLRGMGVDAEDAADVRADMLYLRKIRRGSEFVSLRVKASLVAFLIPTILYLGWIMLKESFGR